MGASFSKSESGPVTKSPFGNLPFGIAGGIRGSFQRPLTQGFGFQKGKGPLATFINQSQGPLASYLPNMQQTGLDIAGGAKGAYGAYQNSIDSFMKQLPGMQNMMGTAMSGSADATAAARTALQDAMSDLPGRASFQEASRRALDPMRTAAAARGMLEGGQAQAGEQGMLSDLAFQAMQNDAANRQNAIAGLTGAAGQQGQMAGMGANLAAMGPAMQQQLFSAYPQLAQMLSSATGMPMDAMNNLMSFFASTQDPSYSLLKLVAPVVAQKSSSISQSAGMGG